MSYVLIVIAALAASGLTLFSGFGLGTILTPVMAIFLPIEAAVAATGVVHFANNFLKLWLFGGHADFKTVFRFGLPAMIGGWLGASILFLLARVKPLLVYNAFGGEHHITWLKLVIAALMLAFAWLEWSKTLKTKEFDPKLMPVGGFASGFFGGLSGHQGAFRSAFLVRAGLEKEAFIATGVTIACLVDFTRVSMYASTFLGDALTGRWGLVAAGTAAAFAGVFIGKRFVEKTTVAGIRALVAVMLALLALLLASGVI